MKNLLVAIACLGAIFAMSSCNEKTDEELVVESVLDSLVSVSKSDGYTDLGLSVMWATKNLGAKKASAAGDYYAWGEMKSKKNYSWETYDFYGEDVLTKYDGKDGLSELKIDDDVVYNKLAERYRIPTQKEWEELLKKCTWRWIRVAKGGKTIEGYVITGTNGNSIFLPAVGYYEGKKLKDESAPFYWSSTLDPSEPRNAWSMGFKAMGVSVRCHGRSIRPVYEE